MTQFYEKLIPVIVIFFLGFSLKKLGIFQKEDGDRFLKLAFHVTLPAITFLAISNVHLKLEFIYLPFIAMINVFIVYFVALLAAKRFHFTKAARGTYLIAAMIMNTGFTLPFLIAAFDKQGLALYTIFDFGNVLLIFTFIYYVAIRHGKDSSAKIDLKKFLHLPPLWGLVLGFIFNIANLPIPTIANNFLDILGSPTIPLIMISLGIYFSPKLIHLDKISSVLFIRIGIGFLLGLAFVNILDLQGIIRAVVIVCSAAPVGYNTLVFASLEELDKEFAASLVSFSILLGIFYIPVLIFFFS
jgi:hypothetical protein